MDEYSNVDQWYSAKERFKVRKPDFNPKVDEEVSKAIGIKVFQNDPRLIKLVAKWKKESGKDPNGDEPDNYLADPRKIEELIETFK